MFKAVFYGKVAERRMHGMIGLAVSRPCLHSRKAKDIMNAGMRCCTSGCHTFQHECKRQRFADVTKQYIMNQACIM